MLILKDRSTLTGTLLQSGVRMRHASNVSLQDLSRPCSTASLTSHLPVCCRKLSPTQHGCRSGCVADRVYRVWMRAVLILPQRVSLHASAAKAAAPVASKTATSPEVVPSLLSLAFPLTCRAGVTEDSHRVDPKLVSCTAWCSQQCASQASFRMKKLRDAALH